MSDILLKSVKRTSEVQPVNTGYENEALDLGENVDMRAVNGVADTRIDVDVTAEKTPNPNYVNVTTVASAADEKKQLEEEEEEGEKSGCIRFVEESQQGLSDFWERHGGAVKWAVAALCIAGYAAYFGYAMYYEFGSESSVRLLWMTMLGVFIVVVNIIDDRCGAQISRRLVQPPVNFIKARFTFFKWAFIVCVAAAVVVFILVEVAIVRPENLVSISGYFIYIFLFFVFSANPAKVRWRPVVWGLGIQFVFALLVLKTAWGYTAFKWLGDRITEFLDYADAGSRFVFGDSFLDHFFAFKVLPVVIYFSTVISILYYLGIMQIVILKIAWVMQRTLGTTAAESVNAAGNIFIGQTEAPLLIRPLIDRMTRSELHAVMTGGFATIAGSVLASYILFGVPANHLITASVMAAPCALAMSKLFYPETETTAQTDDDIRNMEPPPQRNVIEAASAGASAAIPLAANIAANLIAFIALLEFVNTTLTWCGHRVGLWPPKEELTFQLICSYVMWPFAFIMGVAFDDCRKVGELIGVKIFINEFVAYTDLGIIIDNTEEFKEYTAMNGTWTETNGNIYLEATNRTLVGGVMDDRSIVISTYALCGFANISSIGMVMGALGAMAPARASEISQLAVRAMVCGMATSFMNACVAGLFYEGQLAY